MNRTPTVQDAFENERALRALLDSIDGVVYEFDLELDRFRLVRGRPDALLGYTEEEWLAPGFWRAHIHPEDVESAHGFCVESIAAHANHQFEYRMLALDGRAVWIHDHVSVVLSGGAPELLRGVMLDVSPHRSAEEALRASESRYRALMQSLPDPIFVLDARGVLVDVHEPAPSKLLLDREHALGRRLEEALPAAMAARLRELLESTLSSGAPQSGDWVFDDDSHSRVFELRALAFGEDRVLVLSRDVTEQRRAEERHLRSRKLEGLGRLAGGVAHDFNNLLTGILGYAELGERRAGPGPLAECFAGIRQGCDRAAELSQQMLAFAREQLVAPRVVALNPLIREFAGFLARVIGEQTQLDLRLSREAWRTRIDPAQFNQVLMNLVLNARDALGRGGVVRVETRNLRLDRPEHGLPAGDYVELVVIDGGAGMDEATLAHVFEPFFTTKGAAGAGMGLATSYGIVRQAGGAIGIESRLGHGTRVSVRLPRCDAPADPDAQRHEGAPHGSETVLLVEDDEAVREITRNCLAAAGYHVFTACDGVEALQQLERHRLQFDLLLADVVTPRMGGVALAAKLRETRPDLAVLFMSGYAPGQEPATVVADAPFLRKPFGSVELARRVREVLDARARQ